MASCQWSLGAGALLRPLYLVDNAVVSKQEMRKRLAALSFSEKIKILEKLRDRSLAISAAGLRRGAAKGPGNVKGSSK